MVKQHVLDLERKREEQENDQKDDPKHNEILKNNWPLHGKVEVKELSMRYRKNLPLVLDKITFTVEPGHHVGIVGRTGAGKSSIMNAFFRMIEAEEGSIIIDGIDTQTISLDTLRSRMTIIPQVCCLLYIYIHIYIHTVSLLKYSFFTNTRLYIYHIIYYRIRLCLVQLCEKILIHLQYIRMMKFGMHWKNVE